MPNAIVIDVETNGLMDYKRPADAPGQPRVAEFAGIVIEPDGTVIEEFQRYVCPPSRDPGEYEWEMSPETTAVNHITDEMLRTEGVPIEEILDWYSGRITEGHFVIAFGAQFDCKMMRAELRRADRDDLFERTPNICLMRSARPFAKSLGRELVKAGGNNKGWPKQTDVADFLGVIYDADSLHGALADARLTTNIYRGFVDLGFDQQPSVHHAKDYDAIRNAK